MYKGVAIGLSIILKVIYAVKWGVSSLCSQVMCQPPLVDRIRVQNYLDKGEVVKKQTFKEQVSNSILDIIDNKANA